MRECERERELKERVRLGFSMCVRVCLRVRASEMGAHTMAQTNKRA